MDGSLLAYYKRLGITFTVQGDRLFLAANESAITDQIRADIKRQKEEILSEVSLSSESVGRIEINPRQYLKESTHTPYDSNRVESNDIRSSASPPQITAADVLRQLPNGPVNKQEYLAALARLRAASNPSG